VRGPPLPRLPKLAFRILLRRRSDCDVISRNSSSSILPRVASIEWMRGGVTKIAPSFPVAAMLGGFFERPPYTAMSPGRRASDRRLAAQWTVLRVPEELRSHSAAHWHALTAGTRQHARYRPRNPACSSYMTRCRSGSRTSRCSCPPRACPPARTLDPSPIPRFITHGSPSMRAYAIAAPRSSEGFEAGGLSAVALQEGVREGPCSPRRLRTAARCRATRSLCAERAPRPGGARAGREIQVSRLSDCGATLGSVITMWTHPGPRLGTPSANARRYEAFSLLRPPRGLGGRGFESPRSPH